MPQPILRVLIQEKLANGRFPRTHIRRKGLLRGLTLAAFAALGTMTCVASAGAVTRVGSCGTLSTVGETYFLTDDLASCGTCLVVAGDRITIDLAGHVISGSCNDAEVGAGITEGGTRWQGTTVKNGTITGFEVGVDLGLSNRTLIRNLTSSANSVDGIVVGDRSLVKGCLIEGNGRDGISIKGDFGQVQDCTIEGNGNLGIWGGSRLLITHNTVVGNQSGIVVGFSSTVSFNTSSFNTISGVLALDHSLITGNKTIGNGTVAGIASGGLSSVPGDDNGGIDIDVQCPSTVTNNQASGNMNNYNFNGPQSRCQTNNNK